MSNNAGKSVVALLLGAAIGAGVGILFAPEKGSKTREKIKDGFDDAKDNLKHTFDDVSHQLKNKFAIPKRDLEGTYKDLLSCMNHKSEDVISFLETKLSDLKKQNEKFPK